jgi:hypothetical protein
MIKITASLICVLNLLFLNAQSLNISNQYAVGSTGNDGLVTYPSPNGDGYYLIGNSDGNASFDKTEDSNGGYDIWIVKTDNNFVKQWDKTYGGDQGDFFMSAIVLADKIIINATSNSNTSGDKTMDLFGAFTNVWNLCIDLNGNLLWQFQYGGDGGETSSDILLYSDTSVLLAIETFSNISGNKTQNKYGGDDIWLVEAAINDGHIIQQNNVGSTMSERFPRIFKSQTTDRVFMVTSADGGWSDNDKTDIGFSSRDIWLTEIDVSLNVINDKCFGGDAFDEFPRIALDVNGKILISANSRSGVTGNKTTNRISTVPTGSDCWIVKVDNNFDIIWDKSYGGTNNQAVTKMHTMPNGELVVNCVSFSDQGTGNKTSEYFGAGDGWVLFLDDNGDEILQASFGGSQYDGGQTLVHPSDPTKLILSYSSSSGISGNKTVASKGNSDTWIGILDYSTAGLLSLSSNNSITAFPNPSQGSVSINFKELNEASNLTFLTVDGRVLESVNLSENTDSYTWNPEYKGIVFYALKSQNTQLQGKLIFE